MTLPSNPVKLYRREKAKAIARARKRGMSALKRANLKWAAMEKEKKLAGCVLPRFEGKVWSRV